MRGKLLGNEVREIGRVEQVMQSLMDHFEDFEWEGKALESFEPESDVI